jgi:hypothetical protein
MSVFFSPASIDHISMAVAETRTQPMTSQAISRISPAGIEGVSIKVMLDHRFEPALSSLFNRFNVNADPALSAAVLLGHKDTLHCAVDNAMSGCTGSD